MSLIIGAVVIIILVAGTAFFMSGKSDSKKTSQKGAKKEVLQESTEVSAEQKTEKEVEETKNNEVRYSTDDQKVCENKAKTIAKEEQEKSDDRNNKIKEQLYHYINHELQNLFSIYNKEEWNQTSCVGEISPALYKEKDNIIEGLSTVTGKMVKEYFSCIEFKEEEGKLIGYIKDARALKEVFLQFMMPFYPYYYKELSEGGLRYTALLHPNTLRLFQQLTGKKFRPGYRNRYSTGVRAFEWDKDRYKVYRKDGKLLCDAVFDADGIINGYGQKKSVDEKDSEWNIVEEGNWENGEFKGGIIRYEYQKSVK